LKIIARTKPRQPHRNRQQAGGSGVFGCVGVHVGSLILDINGFYRIDDRLPQAIATFARQESSSPVAGIWGRVLGIRLSS